MEEHMASNIRSKRGRRAVVAISLAACVAAVTPAAASASGDDEFTVAVVLPSAANDLAFSQSMVDSLERLKEDGTIDDYVYSENMFVVEDAAAALRGYAEDGHDLVLAHGSQYGGSLEEIAPDFPDTAFAWGTAADTFGLDNVSGYTASADQGAYVMGAMGAMLTDGGSIGVIGPIEVGDGKLYVDGFVAGAQATDPDVDVGTVYTESFSDTTLAAEAATTFIDGGATVLSGTAQMTVGAIGVARERGVLWFGTNSNQTELAPEVVVANQVYHWDVVLADLVEAIKGGDVGGDTYDINLGNGGEVIEFNEDFDLPEDVRAVGEDLIAQLSDGELETGVGAGAPATTESGSVPAAPATPATTAG
jgi:basic membrane lipoprotein Med (substrate-binding protein (PBP1-ABC) superfamily)